MAEPRIEDESCLMQQATNVLWTSLAFYGKLAEEYRLVKDPKKIHNYPAKFIENFEGPVSFNLFDLVFKTTKTPFIWSKGVFKKNFSDGGFDLINTNAKFTPKENGVGGLIDFGDDNRMLACQDNISFLMHTRSSYSSEIMVKEPGRIDARHINKNLFSKIYDIGKDPQVFAKTIEPGSRSFQLITEKTTNLFLFDEVTMEEPGFFASDAMCTLAVIFKNHLQSLPKDSYNFSSKNLQDIVDKSQLIDDTFFNFFKCLSGTSFDISNIAQKLAEHRESFHYWINYLKARDARNILWGNTSFVGDPTYELHMDFNDIDVVIPLS